MKCFYCKREILDEEELKRVQEYGFCNNCQNKLGDNVVLMEVNNAPSKKRYPPITREGESFLYPTGRYMVIKPNNQTGNNKLICVTQDAYNKMWAKTPKFEKFKYYISRILSSNILWIIFIILFLIGVYLTNVSQSLGNLNEFDGFLHPIKTIHNIRNSPELTTNYTNVAGDVIVLTMYGCEDCEKAIPLLEQDFDNIHYVEINSDLGKRIRAAGAEVHCAPTIVLIGFNDTYFTYIPYYNDLKTGEFIYDTEEVKKAKKKQLILKTALKDATEQMFGTGSGTITNEELEKLQKQIN